MDLPPNWPRPIEAHAALDDPASPPHSGDELDCLLCRARLLEAFRRPADRPSPFLPGPISPTSWIDDRSRCLEPELCTPDAPCPACGPSDPDLTVHRTRSWTGQGVWGAACTCGWVKDGFWGPGQPRAAVDQEHAERLARRWADYHEQNPAKET